MAVNEWIAAVELKCDLLPGMRLSMYPILAGIEWWSPWSWRNKG